MKEYKVIYFANDSSFTVVSHDFNLICNAHIALMYRYSKFEYYIFDGNNWDFADIDQLPAYE